MTELTEARKRANRKWDDANKKRKQYLNRRSVCKNFILKSATAEDLENIKEYIKEREAELHS